MDRAYKSGASTTAPTAPASPSLGHPTSGDPVAGVPKTVPGPHWYYMITEELRNIILAAGLTPSHLVVNQVLTALQALFVGLGSFTGANQSLTTSGRQKLPGGLLIQWGSVAAIGAQATITLPTAYPNAIFTVLASKGFGHFVAVADKNGSSLSSILVGATNGTTWATTDTIYWVTIGN